MNDILINEVETHKHLGLTFTHNLCWDQHIDDIVSKASKKLFILRKLKFVLDRLSLQKIYFTFIRPVLEYADVIWDGSSINSKHRLERIHTEAARIVTGATKLASSSSVLKEAGWETLQTRRTKHKLMKFHSMFHCSTPSYLSNLVPHRAFDVHGRNTRNNQNLSAIPCRTQKYQNSFLPSVISSWNALPVEVRNNPSVGQFKHFLNDSDYHAPSYFNTGSRIGQIYHCRLRTESIVTRQQMSAIGRFTQSDDLE